MAVPADKKFGRVAPYFIAYANVITARVTANVGNPHINAFAHKTVVFREFGSGFGAINVAPNGPQRFVLFEGIRNN